jgi:hypothetical protein
MRCVDSSNNSFPNELSSQRSGAPVSAVFPDAFIGAVFPPLCQFDDLARRTAVRRISFCAPASRHAPAVMGVSISLEVPAQGHLQHCRCWGRPLWSPRFCRLAEASDLKQRCFDGCAVSCIRSLNSHPGLSARRSSCSEVDVERHGPRLARKSSSPLRHQLHTVTAIEIVAIHFESNVRIWIGLERTSGRRYCGSANSAHRTKRG